MKKLHVGCMRYFSNVHFCDAYSLIINILENTETSNEDIKYTFDRVKAQKEHLIKIKNQNYNSKNHVIKALMKKRSNCFISLRKAIESFEYSPFEKQQKAAHYIHKFLQQFDRRYYAPSILTQSCFANELEKQINSDSKMAAYIKYLRLNDLIEVIFDLNQKILAIDEEHTKEGATKKGVSQRSKLAAYNDLRKMADTINYVLIKPNCDPETRAWTNDLIEELSSVVKRYKTKKKIHLAKYKTRKKREQEEQKQLQCETTKQNDTAQSTEQDKYIQKERKSVLFINKKEPLSASHWSDGMIIEDGVWVDFDKYRMISTRDKDAC